jgi:beta-lactamase regulating signal transducer with metallopeptidase domain
MNFEFSLIIKSSVFLLLTALLAGLFRKSSASICYMIWAAGLLAVLVLPVMSLFLPAIALPVLPPAAAPRIARLSLPVFVRTAPIAEVATAAGDIQTSVSKPSVVNSPRTPWLFIAWSIGAVLTVVRSLVGIRGVRQLKRASTAVANADWRELLSRLKRELSVFSAVDLRIGGSAIPPMTWGIVRHTILFPAAAADWTTVRIHDVMAHELAHLKRRDGLTQLFAQAACAIYWFNPLVWYAAYRLRIERERACDDQVLKLGANPEDYAAHLVEIARHVNAGLNPATLAMTHLAGLEKRLRLVLDTTRSRRTLSSRSTLLLMCFAALLTALTATGHLAAQVSTPKWAGTWKLNKERSNRQQDARLLEMFDSIGTATLKLEPTQGGVKWSSEIIGGRLNHRQYTETTLPLGVAIDFKDMPYFVRAFNGVVSGGTILVTSRADGSLQMELNYQSGGRSVIRYDTSSDGSLLTISVSPPDVAPIVFDKQ